MSASSVLALDVGDARIGVAVARSDVRLARPLTTLVHNEQLWDAIARLISEHETVTVVVGLPRGLDGQETAQTAKAQAFAAELRQRAGITVALQDEAATSLKAEAELRARGKAYEKSAIDALAATYILEDYLTEHPHV